MRLLLPSQPGLHTAFHRRGVLRVAPIEDLVDFLQNHVSSVWLGEEGDVRPFHPVVDQHLSRMSRHIKDALVGPFLCDELAKLDAVAVRHDHVHDQQIDVTARLTQNRKGFFGVLRFENAVALLTQDSVRHPASDPLVVDNENRGGNAGKRVRQLELQAQGNAPVYGPGGARRKTLDTRR